jgi:RNA polymerase sigma-70 factor (ECF subfamily)
MNAVERQAALDRARQGDREALGQLLESYRPYVQVLARERRGQRAAARLGDSDLAQDALLEAHRGFATFQGATVAEWAAWLRQVVLYSAGHAVRDQFAGKRAVDREQSLAGLSEFLQCSGFTPSAQAIRHEQSARVAEALAQLPAEMQAVLLGRHADGLSHAELAAQLGKTEGAVRVLYVRALRKLRELYQD